MRLKISFHAERPDTTIPINYQYLLASVIYRVLKEAEPGYAQFLHDEGYPASNGRKLKLFSFSKIFSEKKPVVRNEKLLWYGKPHLWVYLSSPLEETFIRHIVVGLFNNQRFEIAKNDLKAQFVVTGMESLPVPEWRESIPCVCLSPLTVSIKTEWRRHPSYLPPDDPAFAEGIRMNLLRKHELLHGPFTSPHDAQFIPDREYFKHRGGVITTRKLIRIKEGTEEETCVRGYVFPFTLRVDPELLQTAWDCGLGEKNSIGFGMWETRNIRNETQIQTPNYPDRRSVPANHEQS